MKKDLQRILYDVIIIGASKEGLSLCSYLNSKNNNFKVAIIDTCTVNKTSKYNNIKADWFMNYSIYCNYYQGIYTITLNNKKLILGKAVVVANGTSPIQNEKLTNAGIIYNLQDLKKTSKKKQLVIVGTKLESVNIALKLANKFKYIYICSETDVLKDDPELQQKVIAAANIAYLPFCKIVSYKVNKNKVLQSVTLDTYTTIHCSDLIGVYGRKGAPSGIPSTLLPTDKDGFAIVDSNNRTTKLSTLFAIGSCANTTNYFEVSTVGRLLLKGGN